MYPEWRYTHTEPKNGFQSGGRWGEGGMEHWKVSSATMVGRQEKFSNSRRSRMAKTIIFWPWWQPFDSFCFETLSFLPLPPIFLFATQKSVDRHTHIFHLYTQSIYTHRKKCFCLSSKQTFRRSWNDTENFWKLSECDNITFGKCFFLKLYLEPCCSILSNDSLNLSMIFLRHIVRQAIRKS